MKIGILTYFWAENPGTFLQAYSTYKAIEKTFSNDRVEMINVKFRNVYYKPAKKYLFSPKFFYKSYCRFRNYRDALTGIKFSQGGYVGKNTTKALDYIQKQEYDVVFVGSDTIFKLNSWDFENDSLPVYYLDGIRTKKVMIAASCGSTSINDFSPNMKKKATSCLYDFYKLGVRDYNTYDLFYKLKRNNINLEIVPDPTFSYEIDEKKANEALVKNNYNFGKKTVIINLPDSFIFINETVKYFKDRNWQIVTFNYTTYADYCLFLHPDEWAGIPNFVNLVITDRFHGSVFSIKNNTPVIGVDCSPERVSSSNSSKIKNLFEEYNIINNYINILDKSSSKQYFNIINYVVNNRIDFAVMNLEKRNKYLSYIQNVLDEH